MSQMLRARDRGLATVEESLAKYLTFKLAEDVYGVEVLHVKKIIEFGKLTHVPLVPKFVKGVLNLLGQVIPVIDLAVYFSENPSPVGKRTCIVIVEVRASEKTVDMGIVVDAVHNVIELQPTDIAPAPDFGKDIRTQFIQGVGKLEGEFIMLLNMDALFSAEELSALHKVQKQAESLVEKEEAEKTA
jgi:purine-binding chemotaxis protein CheW